MSEKSQESKKKDNIINKDEKSLKEDIIYFKEELLKQMNTLEKSISQQKEEIRAKMNGKFILYDDTIEKLDIKFSELKKLVDTNKYIKEQMDNWSHFKSDISKISTGNEIKLTLLEKETYSNFYRIDKLLSNSIIYPRIIDKNARFKNFHEFIDYVLEKISILDIFKSKIELDLQSFKVKVDKIIQGLKIKLDCSINDARQIVKNGVKENEIIIKDYITGKIYDLQVKNNEFEKKIEKNIEELNLGLNAFDEKMKLVNEKFEEKMGIDKFKEEKDSVYYDINQCRNKDNELNNRINELEKYKATQERNNYWSMKSLGQRKKGSMMNLNMGFDLMNLKNFENFNNNGSLSNETNLEGKNKNQLKLNLGDDTNRLDSISENDDNSVDLNNNNEGKLNKLTLDKNLITTDEDNTNENFINNKRKNSKKATKSMRSLYKLRVSLKDINAQFKLDSLNDDKNKSSRDNYAQSLPMTTPIKNKYINFNEFFAFNYGLKLKNFFGPQTLRSPVLIKNKEIKFFDEEIDPKKARNSDFITEGSISKNNKNKKSEESKKTWERLLSPKVKRKSDLNILDTYLVNYRSLKKNKTLNKMMMSRSYKNFFKG